MCGCARDRHNAETAREPSAMAFYQKRTRRQADVRNGRRCALPQPKGRLLCSLMVVRRSQRWCDGCYHIPRSEFGESLHPDAAGGAHGMRCGPPEAPEAPEAPPRPLAALLQPGGPAANPAGESARRPTSRLPPGCVSWPGFWHLLVIYERSLCRNHCVVGPPSSVATQVVEHPRASPPRG